MIIRLYIFLEILVYFLLSTNAGCGPYRVRKLIELFNDVNLNAVPFIRLFNASQLYP